MDFFAPAEYCPLQCPLCKVYLAVEMPYTLTEGGKVHCGRCNSIFFFSPIAPVFQSILPPEFQMCSQNACLADCRRNQPLPPVAPSASFEPTSPRTPFVVKPPEKKHRLPSAYNRFMREEIQRIKASKPDIPHREAFSMAAKNWAKNDPRSSPTVSSSDLNWVKIDPRSSPTVSSSDLNVAQRPVSLPIERGNGLKTESFDIFKQIERKN